MQIAKQKRYGEASRILLVEDEPTNMAILSGYLREAGYLVDEATDGSAGWDMLQKQKAYDLVITDRRMPNMDGLELAKRIKADPELRAIPVIMQTAATTLAEVSEGVKAGVYYYLAKPYEEETLMTLTKGALRDREKTNTFEQRLSRQKEALGAFVSGEFHIKTPEEAENIAFLLGSLFPRPELAVSGIYELAINAIEHGNLKIGFDEKSKLISNSGLEAEVKNRLSRPENARKKVIVRYQQSHDEMSVTITDEGEGFDWRPFLEIEPSRATQGNGRGIAKANLISFDKLSYHGTGNQVQVISKVA
jgi:CheY-like chemotaxis protein